MVMEAALRENWGGENVRGRKSRARDQSLWQGGKEEGGEGGEGGRKEERRKEERITW